MKPYLLLSILLFALFGCAAPQPAPAAAPQAQPTQALLPLLVEQMVAQALTQTAQAVTSTPQASVTPSPSPVAATLTPEQTASAAPVPAAAGLLALQEDGSALYSDSQANFSIHIPAGWLAVRPNEAEFSEALNFYQQNDPLVYAALDTRQNQNALRLFALNLQYENFESEPVPSIEFQWNADQELTLDEANLQALADELAATNVGLAVSSMDIVTNPAQIRLGAVESQTGGVVQKRVYFPASRGFMLVTLTVTERIKLDMLPAFDAMMDTLE